MGGYGSGRPSQHGKTSQYRSLDVNLIAKAGLLRPGCSAGWHWTVDREKVANISTRAEAGRLILTYSFREDGGKWQPVAETVRLAQVPCAYGGSRTYFLCPGVVNGRNCGRRVGKLCSARYFVCRHCLQLTCPVQCEEPHYRQLRRANKRRAALGGDPGTCSFFSKPKGMHWRTYNRIVAETGSAENRADREFPGTICRPTPPIRAALPRLLPSQISASASSLRLWFAFFVFRARRLKVVPSKSARNPIAAPMATSSQTCRHRFRLLARWESSRESGFKPFGIKRKIGCGIVIPHPKHLIYFSILVAGVRFELTTFRL